MSYGIMPYKIRLEALNAVIESRDEALTVWAQGRCRRELVSLDQQLDGERPAAEYLADLMLGRAAVEEDPHLYGYSVKALCEVWGVMLANDQWSGMRWGWFDAVTEAVGRAGGRYSFADLVAGGPGVDIPAPDDFPAMGHVTHEESAAHLERLDAIDLAAIEDRDVVKAVRQVQSWLRECRRDDMDLVLFYH